MLRQVDQIRDDIHKLEEELAQLAAGSAMLNPQVRQRINEILETLPRLRGEVAKLARGGPIGHS